MRAPLQIQNNLQIPIEIKLRNQEEGLMEAGLLDLAEEQIVTTAAPASGGEDYFLKIEKESNELVPLRLRAIG